MNQAQSAQARETPKRTVAILGTRGYPSFYGGFEAAVRKLAPYFVRTGGWSVTVYGRPGTTVPEDYNRDHLVASVVTKGFETKSLSTLSFGLSATLHAVRSKPDVALVMNVGNGFFLPLLKCRGIKTIVNVDGIEWDRQKWGRFAKLVFKLGAALTAKFADELVFDSRAIEKRWQEDFKKSGIFIPYGGEMPDLLPLEPKLQQGNYILVVARLVPENTIAEFFEAIESISELYTIVIVGSSGYRSELDQRAEAISQKYANVHWLGHVSDDSRLFGLWKHCGLYFHGHSVGGTNPTLVQAMTLGCAVVARDTPYNREVLGSAGIFCLPNSAAIASAVMNTMQASDLRLKLGLQNQTRARNFYNWENVCKAYLEILNSVVER